MSKQPFLFLGIYGEKFFKKWVHYALDLIFNSIVFPCLKSLRVALL